MPKQAETTVGDLRLVFTGDVLALDDVPIEITLEGEGIEGSMIFTFEENGGEQDLDFETDEKGETLQIKFKNFGRGVGASTLKKNLRVGEFGGKTTYVGMASRLAKRLISAGKSSAWNMGRPTIRKCEGENGSRIPI